MKRELIKYENLSRELKEEIEKYYAAEKDKAASLSIEEGMVRWFRDSFDNWLIKRFGQGDSENKRKHFRLEVEVPIRIIDTLIESSGNDKDAMDLIGNVINISRGGLYFIYNSPIEVSSIIKVIIDLSKKDNELSEIEALAMVVRVDKLDDSDYGIGIMFSSIYDSVRENIDVFILKNLANYLYSDK